MKNLIFTISVLLILVSCSSKLNTQKLAVETDYKRVPGTRILAKIPDAYQYVKRGTYVIAGTQTIKFNYGIIGFDELVAGMDKDKLKVIDYEGNLAYFVELQDSVNQQTIKMLVVDFGGKAFFCVAKVNFGNTKALKEVDKILNSIKYDETAALDILDGLPFYLDLTITEFQLAMTAFNHFRFTADGIFERNNKSVTNFIISDLSPKNLERTALYVKRMRDRTVKNEDIKCSEVEKIKIGIYDAFIFESESDYMDLKRKSIHVYLNEADKTIHFRGDAYEEHERNMKDFRKTVESIVIK